MYVRAILSGNITIRSLPPLLDWKLRTCVIWEERPTGEDTCFPTKQGTRPAYHVFVGLDLLNARADRRSSPCRTSCCPSHCRGKYVGKRERKGARSERERTVRAVFSLVKVLSRLFVVVAVAAVFVTKNVYLTADLRPKSFANGHPAMI